jgi:hypothetical protein
MMNPTEATERYKRVDAMSQAMILVRLAHMMTIAARESYEIGTEGVRDPIALRRSNEVMHRVTGQIRALLEGDERRFPDEVIIRIIDGLQDDAHQMLFVKAVSEIDAQNEEGEQGMAGQPA